MTNVNEFGDPIVSPGVNEFGDTIVNRGTIAMQQAVEESQAQRADFKEKAANSLQSVLSTLTNEFLASFQGTTPITASRKPLGELKNFDSGPGFSDEEGQEVPANTDDHVILRDPETNKIMVFERTEDTDEGSLAALGRLLGFGTIATPIRGVGAVSQAGKRVADAATVGVDTSLAAATQGRSTAMVQNTLGGLPIAGGPIARQAERVPRQGAQKLDEISSEIGSATDAAGAGASLRRGAEGFVGERAGVRLPDDVVTNAILKPARQTSFKSKTEAVYQRAFDQLEGIGSIDLSGTLETLAGATRRFDNTKLGKEFVNPRLQRWANIIEEAGGALSLNDLRQFRSEVGSLLSTPAILRDIDDAALNGVYAALSKDMAKAAAQIGPEAVNAMKRADQFYGAGRTRIKNALRVLTDPKRADESLYQTIQRTTNARTGDIKKLTAVRRSMPKEEWDIFVSTFLRDMGVPNPSAVNLGEQAQFSVDTFVTNFAKLSPKAKEVMFGEKVALRKMLDQLASALSAQKQVTNVAHIGRSSAAIVTAGVTAAAFTAPVQTAIALTGVAGAALLMTSPRFIAWWVQGIKTTNIPRHMERLALIAKDDPELAPVVEEFRQLFSQALESGQQAAASGQGGLPSPTIPIPGRN